MKPPRLLLVSLLVLNLFSVARTHAQAMEELKVDIKPAELIKKVRAAIADDAAWSSVHTVRATGVMQIGGQALTFEALEAKGDLAVQTLKSDETVVAQSGCDGKVAWERGEAGIEVLKGEELNESLDDCAFMSELDLGSYKEIKVTGKARQGQTSFYLVDAFTHRGTHDVVTIDADTFLPQALITQRHDDGAKMTTVSVFSDYRRVSGLLYPHAVNLKIGDQKGVMKVTKLEINPAVDRGVFARPRS